MLDWCRNTLNKYKRGLLTGGAVTTGIVAMGYACKQKLLTWQQEQMEMLLRSSHTEQHYLQHHQNMITTLSGYFIKLNERISELCDTDSTLRSLKEGSVSKLAGWELLRKQVLTKLLLSLYSSTLLTIFLSVQLTVVKAKILQTMSNESRESACESRDSDVNKTTKSYLSKISLVLEHSVPEIMRICESEVERICSDVTSRDVITSSDDVMTRGCGGFELDSAVNLGDMRVLLDNVNVVEQMDLVRLCRMDLGEDIMNQQLKEVIIVTMDILESQDFRNTYYTCVSHAQDYYSKQISRVVQQDPVILAKLLSPINKIPNKILSSEREGYISHVLDCAVLKVLSCNLYQGLT